MDLQVLQYVTASAPCALSAPPGGKASLDAVDEAGLGRREGGLFRLSQGCSMHLPKHEHRHVNCCFTENVLAQGLVKEQYCELGQAPPSWQWMKNNLLLQALTAMPFHWPNQSLWLEFGHT